MARTTKPHPSEIAEARARILEILGDNREIYTCLRHVSQSGMTRHISVHAIGTIKVQKNGKEYERPYLYDLTGMAAKVCSYSFNKDRDALVIGGAGMDIGFALVYDLSRVLFEGTTPDQEPRTASSLPTNTDAGYVLSHRWI